MDIKQQTIDILIGYVEGEIQKIVNEGDYTAELYRNSRGSEAVVNTTMLDNYSLNRLHRLMAEDEILKFI